MEYFKMLGLAVIAASALIAFAAAGTASATVLCDTTTTPCNQKWSAGTQLEFEIAPGTEGIWETTDGKTVVAKCTEGELKGKPSSGGASETVKVPVQASDFTWPGCTVNTATLEGGELEIHAIEGSDNGAVTATGFSFTTTAFGVSCIYTFASSTNIGTLTASATGDATLHINTVFTKKSGGFLCPTDLKWREEFTQVKPEGTALYVEPS
jgi:hypothetical protein